VSDRGQFGKDVYIHFALQSSVRGAERHPGPRADGPVTWSRRVLRKKWRSIGSSDRTFGFANHLVCVTGRWKKNLERGHAATRRHGGQRETTPHPRNVGFDDISARRYSTPESQGREKGRRVACFSIS